MASCQLASCSSSRQETDQVTQQWASRHRESLVVESRDSSSSRQEAGQLARRRIGLPIVASGCSSSRRVTLRVAWRCSSAQEELVEAARHCAPPPESSSSRQAASAGLVAASQGRPPRLDRNHRVRLFVTAEIVASWSSISKQLIAQQVFASRGRSASRHKTRQLAWCRVRRLIVVASGDRLWVYQAASRHVRQPLVASTH